jgi:hypothetical protein
MIKTLFTYFNHQIKSITSLNCNMTLIQFVFLRGDTALCHSWSDEVQNSSDSTLVPVISLNISENLVKSLQQESSNGISWRFWMLCGCAQCCVSYFWSDKDFLRPVISRDFQISREIVTAEKFKMQFHECLGCFVDVALRGLFLIG